MLISEEKMSIFNFIL